LLDEGEPVLVSAHLDTIVALVPAELDVRRVAEASGVATHQVLVGREGSGLLDVRERYEDLLSMRRHTQGTGVHEQDAFLLPRVLAGDARARDEFVKRTLDVLEHAKGSADLKGTLRTLCQTGFSLSATADRLQIHISTLRYRLERLEAILERDLRDPVVRFELQLAFAVRRYCEPAR
jgi:purine catabolism regulator